MDRKSTEWLIKYIFEDCRDLWWLEEISRDNRCETREETIDLLTDIRKRLPDAPRKNDMNNPGVIRKADLKKAIGALLARMRTSTY